MPTGVAIPDARRQLFGAAERVLLRDGPNALTSRAVTTEAGCAKGVVHRHFADFDTFLAELLLERVRRIEEQAERLRAAAGTRTVVDLLTEALTELFDPVTVGAVGLVASRDGLRAKLRRTTPTGIPVLAEATTMLASYLEAERAAGRLAPEAGTGTLAPTLIGAGHLLFADRTGPPPGPEAVRGTAIAIVGGVLRRV